MAKRHPHSASSTALRKDPEETEPDESSDEEIPAAATVSNVEKYIENNGAKIGIILLLAVIALVVVGWVIYSKNAQERAAAIEFTSASDLTEYNLVIEKHGGTVAAGNALIMKAKSHWDSGEQSASMDTLNQFLGNYPDHPFRAEGEYARAVREIEMGKEEAGVKHLKEVIDKHPKSAVAALAQLYVADLALEKGDVEGAEKLYDEAAKMGIGVVSEVERRLSDLKAGSPIEAIDPPPLPKEEEEKDPAAPPVLPPVVPEPPVGSEVPPTAPEPTAPEPSAPEPSAPEPSAPEPEPAEPTAPEPTAPEPEPAEPTAPEPTAPEPEPAEPAGPETAAGSEN